MAISSRRLRQVAVIVIGALLFTSCGQQTAEYDSTAPAIGGTPAASVEEVTAAESPTDVPAPTPTSTVTFEAATSAPAPEPTPTNEPVEEEEPSPPPTSTPQPSDGTDSTDHYALAGIGGELGCENADELWRLMRETELRPLVEEMQRNIWLCPGTEAVAAEFDCYYDVMARIIVALEDMGSSGVLLADDFRRGDQVFCRSEYIISLSPEDIIERQQQDDG